ncbi:MAG: nucleotidyltransferase family protein [Burkholderiaceae bacterium]
MSDISTDAAGISPRAALGSILAGHALVWPGELGLHEREWLELASAEQVVALVDWRIRGGLAGVPEAVSQAFFSSARERVAHLMIRQAEARRVLGMFAAAGISCLLLKGSALAYWAYPEVYLRECVDVDLLFADREDAVQAAGMLKNDGYVIRQHFGNAASREFLCVRPKPDVWRVEFDMHWGLSGKPVFARRLDFSELEAESIPLPGLAPAARGLGAIHACLHACMHRTADLSNGSGDRLKWLFDLHLLALSLNVADWSRLQALAIDRGIAGICADGFAQAANVFHTPLPDGTLDELWRVSSGERLNPKRLRHWVYFQLENLRSLPDWPSRAQWTWERLLPTADYREDVGVVDKGFFRDRARRAMRRLSS